MARVDNLENFLTDVATAIKDKKGDDTPIPATNFDTEITNLPSGGGKYAPRYISFRDYTGSELTEELANLDISNLTTMRYMFADCKNVTELDVSDFDTSNITDMSSMFNGCNKLTSVDVSNFNTSKVTTMDRMFASLYKIDNINLANFDTSNVTNMNSMFSNSNLVNLDLSSFDMSKVNNCGNMFIWSSKFENLLFGKNLGKAYTDKTNKVYNYRLNISYSKSLTHDSLMSVINNLYDLNLTYNVANGGTLYTQELILGSDNLAKLTADEIAIATNKGWTVS